MKKLFAPLFVLLFPFLAVANMSSPIEDGVTPASPFTSSHAFINHEDIRIIQDTDLKTARFEVTYYLTTDMDGWQIPLLFYAPDYLDGFEVWVDGKSIVMTAMPDNYNDSNLHYGELLKFYGQSPWNNSTDRIESGEYQDMVTIRFDELKFFYANLSKGSHTIKVFYKAKCQIDKSNRINEYSIHYSLTPARYWKSFGTLTVSLISSDGIAALSTNLGKPTKGSLNTTATWEFKNLPSDFIVVTYTPKISAFAQSLVNFTPEALALIFIVLLILLHLYAMRAYRKKHYGKKYSWVLTTGSLALPLMAIFIYYYCQLFVVWAIGEHGNERGIGYTFLMIIFYPVMLLVYGLFMWIADIMITRKMRRNNNYTA